MAALLCRCARTPAGEGVVLLVFRPRHGSGAVLQFPHAAGAGGEGDRLALLHAILLEDHLTRRENIRAVAHREFAMALGESMLAEGHAHGDTAFSEDARRKFHVADFDVVARLFVSKSDSVNGNTPAADLGDR